MTIRWITPSLGTAPASSVMEVEGLKLLDVRNLVDKGGNPISAVREVIDAGVVALESGLRVVVGCDYGISRSNAVAAGILAKSSRQPFVESLRRVLAKTDSAEIKLEMVDVVRSAVEANPPIKEQVNGILVTGASGFLGAAVIKELRKADVRIVTLTRDELDLQRDRARFSLLMSEAGIDRVVHLANPRVYTSNIALGETLSMLRNVIEVCVRCGAHLVYPSGWEVYSAYRTTGLLADESTPLHAKGPYGDTKVLAESLIRQFRSLDGLACALLRPSPIYGAGSGRPKFIYTFIDNALSGSDITTHRYRNGRPALDLLHVDDAARAIAGVVLNRISGDFNIGTGNMTETRTVAEWMLQFAGRDTPVQEIEIDDDVARVSLDASRASRALGWQPVRNLKEEMHALFNRRASDVNWRNQ